MGRRRLPRALLQLTLVLVLALSPATGARADDPGVAPPVTVEQPGERARPAGPDTAAVEPPVSVEPIDPGQPAPVESAAPSLPAPVEATEPDPSAGGAPPAPPAPAQRPLPDVSGLTIATPGNNIVGLNVARLRQDRYVAAAAELANANGGDWGYLTVVFTAQERDSAAGELLLQQLLDRCYEHRLQPIIRVATRFNELDGTWTRPDEDDSAKWRAFLERGRYPTRQVWVIAGNEPNLGREWGGAVDAPAYARYLARFLDAFADSDRFRVVNAPLDASNTTELPRMQDAYEFLAEMEAAEPGIFTRLAGWASNPYRVLGQGDGLRYTHLAYEAELAAIGRDMPVLITEAGHLDTGDPHEIAAFYAEAFRDWLADSRVVAVTPLFWHPDRGQYWMFDFNQDGRITYTSPTYELIQRLPRTRGSPEFVPDLENVARAAPTPTAFQPAAGPAHEQDARAAGPPDNDAPDAERLRVGNTDGLGVRLRAEPSRSARAIAVLPDGASVRAIGPERRSENLTWRPVRTEDGAEGWVAADFLTRPRTAE